MPQSQYGLLSYKFAIFIIQEPRAGELFKSCYNSLSFCLRSLDSSEVPSSFGIFSLFFYFFKLIVLICWAECRCRPVLLPRTRALHDDVPYSYKWRCVPRPADKCIYRTICRMEVDVWVHGHRCLRYVCCGILHHTRDRIQERDSQLRSSRIGVWPEKELVCRLVPYFWLWLSNFVLGMARLYTSVACVSPQLFLSNISPLGLVSWVELTQNSCMARYSRKFIQEVF